MTDFFVAIGLVCVIEGLLFGAAPDVVKSHLASLLEMPSNQLRIGGLIFAGVGVGIIWLIRALGS